MVCNVWDGAAGMDWINDLGIAPPQNGNWQLALSAQGAHR
jgi:hypothetical protein